MKNGSRKKRVKGEALLVRISPQGAVHIQGEKARIDGLVARLRAKGLVIHLKKQSPCG